MVDLQYYLHACDAFRTCSTALTNTFIYSFSSNYEYLLFIIYSELRFLMTKYFAAVISIAGIVADESDFLVFFHFFF